MEYTKVTYSECDTTGSAVDVALIMDGRTDTTATLAGTTLDEVYIVFSQDDIVHRRFVSYVLLNGVQFDSDTASLTIWTKTGGLAGVTVTEYTLELGDTSLQNVIVPIEEQVDTVILTCTVGNVTLGEIEIYATGETHRSRPAPETASPITMASTEVWVCGYPLALVSEFLPDMEESDDSVGVYGYDSTVDTKVLSSGNLTITAINDNSTKVLLDLLSNVNPYPETESSYGGKPVGDVKLDVVRLWRNSNGDYYYRAEFFGNLRAAVSVAGGNPKETGKVTVQGRCSLPVRFEYETGSLAIVSDIAPMTSDPDGLSAYGLFESYLETRDAADGSYGPYWDDDYPPVQIPSCGAYPNSLMYLLSIELQQRDASGALLKYCKIPVSLSSMDEVDRLNGAIRISVSDLQGTGFSIDQVTHVFCHWLATNDNLPDGNYLLGDYYRTRGRFDITAG